MWVTYEAWFTRLKLQSFACKRKAQVDDGADENERKLDIRANTLSSLPLDTAWVEAEPIPHDNESEAGAT